MVLHFLVVHHTIDSYFNPPPLLQFQFVLQGGKTKILFPIYYEADLPPVSGVTKKVIEKELYVTDFQRFDRDTATPHHLVDDSPWYLPYPGKLVNRRDHECLFCQALVLTDVFYTFISLNSSSLSSLSFSASVLIVFYIVVLCICWSSEYISRCFGCHAVSTIDTPYQSTTCAHRVRSVTQRCLQGKEVLVPVWVFEHE